MSKKGVRYIESEVCIDVCKHLSIVQFMRYLKCKISLIIFDRDANLKYKYAQRSFWCSGYILFLIREISSIKLQEKSRKQKCTDRVYHSRCNIENRKRAKS